MKTMGSRSATELLQLPVQLSGIGLGRPVDLLLDPAAWRVLGFVVLCGDESLRFLAYAAADPHEDEIAVSSALLLLEDVDFYRSRARSMRALVGAPVVSTGHEVGELRDVLVSASGTVDALLVAQHEQIRQVEAAGARIGYVAAA
jgi:hypothetical protein